MSFRVPANASPKRAAIYDRAASLLEPSPRIPPDQWGQENRVYGPTTGHPGPRDPYLTPYVIAPIRALVAGRYKRVVEVFGAQTGKTESLLDVIGERLDREPAPILYVGPSKEFCTDQLEPRVMQLLDEAKALAEKVARGKRMKKTLKRVAGVPLRLAHAGSSTALKSDPAAIGLIDEYDEMLSNIKGQGDPLGLVEARGDTYVDFVTAITSTPSLGMADVEKDPESGLEFWAVSPPEQVQSPIWRLWQEGTRFHWAWPCPQCEEFFIPRKQNLKYDEGATPTQAHEQAYVECPNCGGVIEDHDKAEMNAAGRYVAPGQRIEKGGEVIGEPAPNSTASFWVSGLASPFRTFGDRAERLVRAEQSGESDKKQTATNAGFGELFAPGDGDAPEWKEVARLRSLHGRGEVPEGVAKICVTIDVQKQCLVYTVRGWGVKASSWLIDHGELWGHTGEDDGPTGTMGLPIWTEAAELVQSMWDDVPVHRVFIDSGFRPGKEELVPVNRVYEFCSNFKGTVFPTKGYRTQSKPLAVSHPDVNSQGKVAKYGLTLIRLDTDYWKRWVHERIRAWPDDEPGAWLLHADVDRDYCKQVVSEARTVSAAGVPEWVARSRDNHFLDCEAMQAALGYFIGAHDWRILAPDNPPPEKKQDAPSKYWGNRGQDYWPEPR